MTRRLDTKTLETAAEFYAAEFLRPDAMHPRAKGRFIGGRGLVMQDLFTATFKDEFEALIDLVKAHMGPATLKKFEPLAAAQFTPRNDKVFADLLAWKLALDPAGNHIAGRVGTTQLHGVRVVGKRVNRRGQVKNVYWPIYAGEGEERAAGNTSLDAIPEGAEPLAVGALNTRISNETALLGLNAMVDNLDEGLGAAVIQGRTGAQPADPDTPVTGVLLFTLACSDPAFGAAADANPGAIATAAAIADDVSADATGPLGYCRGSSSNDGATPLDDHIDGEAGVSGADFNLNTLAIVAGATISLTSWTWTLPEG